MTYKNIKKISMKSNRYNLLGVQIDALTISQLNSLISQAVQSKNKSIIAHHNMHSIYLYHHDLKMKAFYAKADYVHIDGMALVIMGKLLGFPLKREHRVTYADWVWQLIPEAVNQGWRVFYLGSKPGVAAKGAQILHDKFLGLEMATVHGYFHASPKNLENQIVLAQINAYNPHVLMVGMGMPRQEHWILDNLDQIQTNVILTCGACIDYVAGVIPTPPRWMGKVGLEWLYRLFSEPKRLWKRYLVEPWFLLKILFQSTLSSCIKSK